MLRAWSQPYRGMPALLWNLLLIQLLMNAGHFMAIPLLAVHLKDTLGLGAASIGTVLTVHLLSARLLPAMTGPVADRLGPRGLIIGGLFVRAAGLAGVANSESVASLCAMAFLMGAGTSLYESAVYGIFGRQPRNIASRVFVINNQALNAGVIVGPTVGAFVATLGTSNVFLVSAAVFVLLSLWATAFDITKNVTFENVSMRQSMKTVMLDRNFILLFISTLPWWLLFSQLYIVFPIYIKEIGGRDSLVAAMFLVNGLVGLLVMFVSIFVFERISPRKILIGSYVGLAIIYALVPFSAAVWWFFVIVALYTIAETHILPAIESLTAEAARRGSESTYFGAAGLAWALSGSVGNYAGSWLILEAGPHLTWLSLSMVAVVGVSSAFWLRAPTVKLDQSVQKLTY